MLALVVRLPGGARSPGISQRSGSPDGLAPFAVSDLRSGQRLAVDVLLEDHTGVTAVAEVEWLEALPKPGSSRIGMGLRLVGLEHADPNRLREALTVAPETDVARLSARVTELRRALAALVEAREGFLGAMHAAPDADDLLPEEDRYVEAFRAARVALQERE
jgi:hypothetical protein